MTRILKPALIYFLIVFGVGFMLGPIRVLFLEPRLGMRAAELIEMPFMLLAIVLACRWVVRRYASRAGSPELLAIGFLALTLVLVLEVTVVLQLRGLSLGTYLAERDPVSGTAYLVTLILFALMPWWMGRYRAN